jgi:putative DNA methylase
MTETPRYCKRLIEVDLPIKRISAHARREKSIRHGHISTLHIWWARRPLAACRAVICAALWPDPADPLCPESFRAAAREQMLVWATAHLGSLSKESYARFNSIARDPTKLLHADELRASLLDFIADFANWDNSAASEFLATSRTLTQAAHEALGGAPGTRPLVLDPFAGGGSIPLEGLRVGADAFASDLNPIPVLLNKVALEYIPRHGKRLAEEIRKWGEWARRAAEKELAEYFASDDGPGKPIAYLWARTIRCEGPGCGAEVPLIRSLWLSKNANRSAALELIPDRTRGVIAVHVIVKRSVGWVRRDDGQTVVKRPSFDGTVRRGSATCPCCGYTTAAERVRQQFRGREGGAGDARLLAVVTTTSGETGRQYRSPTQADLRSVEAARKHIRELANDAATFTSLFPHESLPYLRSIFNIHLLDVTKWMSLFTPRQLLVISTLGRTIRKARDEMGNSDPALADAVVTCLALAVDRQADYNSSLCRWVPGGEFLASTFGRQALGIIWDFAEVNPFGQATGDFEGAFTWVSSVCENLASAEMLEGHSEQASATQHPLPDDSVAAFITDPPYYDAVPYADLSDFFYVWLKRSLKGSHVHLFGEDTSPKTLEVVQLAERNIAYAYKTRENFERLMKDALAEGRRVTLPGGIGVIVFAHKSTEAWEAMIQAVIDAGWIVVASWPIDTERQVRLRAMDSAALASSVHLVCRPRENADGTVATDEVGEWRSILKELPLRIHEWMPRLATEGVVGADAIFACLGPALEVFSRYSRVEKANGETVTLKEYLEHVWAAVAREALSMVLDSADASGLEPDGRLTAIWLWTLAGRLSDGDSQTEGGEDEPPVDDDEEDASASKSAGGGFVLEFDAARKIAQGLGARLEELGQMVAVKGDKARLLPVAERAKYLFGKSASTATTARKAKKKQLGLFAEIEEAAAEQGWGDVGSPQPGKTTLDRIHQSMLLFGAGRGEALKRFLVEEGVGNQPHFWKLAQSLSALYPIGTDEKRWIDGVLGRKKGFGFA